jgi:hypothetical protein
VEESATHIVREATIAGTDLREIIALEPQRKVTFFQATGPREGAIVNELFEDEAGATSASFLLLHRPARQSAEWPRRAGRTGAIRQRQGLQGALLSTLKRTRNCLLRASRAGPAVCGLLLHGGAVGAVQARAAAAATSATATTAA